MDIQNYIKNNKLKISVKPNSKKNEIKIENNQVKVLIKAQPEKGKANKELIKFLSKTLKKKITIKSGKTSKTKIISL